MTIIMTSLFCQAGDVARIAKGLRRWTLSFGLAAAAFGAYAQQPYTDAMTRYPRKLMPHFEPSVENQSAWLDERHVLLSARVLPGWSAAEEDLSRIVVLDTETGAFEDTAYRGELLCYTPERMVIRAHWWVGGSPTDEKNRGNHFAAGKFGGELSPFTWPKGHFLSKATCEHYPYVTRLSDELIFSDEPLRPGNPIIRMRRYFGDEQLDTRGYWLIDAQGRELNYIRSDQGSSPLSGRTTYLPWLDAHIASEAYPRVTQIIGRDGQVTVYRAPRFLIDWAARFIGTGVGFMTRGGMVWEMRPKTGFFKLQGLYLQRPDGKVLRIDDGYALDWKSVSPSGCKMLIGRWEGDTSHLISAQERGARTNHIVIDICEGDKK